MKKSCTDVYCKPVTLKLNTSFDLITDNWVYQILRTCEMYLVLKTNVLTTH